MNKKIVFLDIDGTITTFRGELPESAGKALKEAKAAGHEIVICTGRTITQIYPWLLETGCFTGIIAGAGAYMEKDGKVFYSRHVTEEHVKLFVEYMDKLDATWFLQADSGVYTSRKIMDRIEVSYRTNKVDREERKRLLGEILTAEAPTALQDVNKMAYYGASASLEEIRSVLGEVFTVTASSFELTNTSDGEVTMKGCDKGTAMERYLAYIGADREDSIAVGDGPNDLEMLDYAAVGVAMGNACEELKAHADRITDDVDKDGLYAAFKQMGLLQN
ncbi:MAG: HAD family hydrolase [Eubacteriales bacterium]|nr:HAD family hydrolase [Eubacteriales bacterium]